MALGSTVLARTLGVGPESTTRTISLRHPPVPSWTGLQAHGFARNWNTVGVDLHETGRSGFTAYWGCLAAVGGTASDRRRLGSVGDWPMASPTAEQQGATTRR